MTLSAHPIRKTLSMALRYQQLGTDPRRAAIEAGAGSILANAGARETAEVINLQQKRQHG